MSSNQHLIFCLLREDVVDRNAQDIKGLTAFDYALKDKDYMTCLILAGFDCKTSTQKWDQQKMLQETLERCKMIR
jgi:hypothetical protein